MWYVRDVLYAVLYVRVTCFVVSGCGVSRRYIDVCYCDMFSVVNVYRGHLKFCVVCIKGAVLGKVHRAIRDIRHVKNIMNSVQYILFVNGKSAVDVIVIMFFQHTC